MILETILEVLGVIQFMQIGIVTIQTMLVLFLRTKRDRLILNIKTTIMIKIMTILSIVMLIIYSIWSYIIIWGSTDVVNYYIPFGTAILEMNNPYDNLYANSGPLLYTLFALCCMTPNPEMAIKFLMVFCYFIVVLLVIILGRSLSNGNNILKDSTGFLAGSYCMSSFILLNGAVRQFDDDIILTLAFCMSILVFLNDSSRLKWKASIISAILVPLKFFSGLVFIVLALTTLDNTREKIQSLILYIALVSLAFIPFVAVWGFQVATAPIRFSLTFGNPRRLSYTYFLRQVFGVSNLHLNLFAAFIGISLLVLYCGIKYYFFRNLYSSNSGIALLSSIAIAIVCLNLSQTFLTMWYLMWAIPILSLILECSASAKSFSTHLSILLTFMILNAAGLIWYYAFNMSIEIFLLLTSIIGSTTLFAFYFEIILLEYQTSKIG